MTRNKVSISGVDIDVIDLNSMLEAIFGYVAQGGPALVNNVNVHAMNIANENEAFKSILNDSELVFCDGFGVKLGARLLGVRLGQRMTPPDWIDDFFERCISEKASVYFIGDEDEVVAGFATAVAEKHPELEIAGYRNGFFDLDGPEAESIAEELEKLRPDIIVTGMGMPRQELWASRMRERLGFGVYIATGALFRWYTGHSKRAPRWLTDNGLEWLARVVGEPRRMWRRYLVGNPAFLWRVFRERLSS